MSSLRLAAFRVYGLLLALVCGLTFHFHDSFISSFLSFYFLLVCPHALPLLIFSNPSKSTSLLNGCDYVVSLSKVDLLCRPGPSLAIVPFCTITDTPQRWLRYFRYPCFRHCLLPVRVSSNVRLIIWCSPHNLIIDTTSVEVKLLTIASVKCNTFFMSSKISLIMNSCH